MAPQRDSARCAASVMPSPAPGPSPTIYNMPMTSGPYPRRFAASLLNVQVNALAASATVTPSSTCLRQMSRPEPEAQAAARSHTQSTPVTDSTNGEDENEPSAPCQALRGEELDGEPRRVRPGKQPLLVRFQIDGRRPGKGARRHPRQFASALDRAGDRSPGRAATAADPYVDAARDYMEGGFASQLPVLRQRARAHHHLRAGALLRQAHPGRGRPPRPLHP